MPKFPRGSAPYLFAMIQSAITTGVATAIAMMRMSEFNAAAVADWLVSWSIAWVTILPVVVTLAPVIRRIALTMTKA